MIIKLLVEGGNMKPGPAIAQKLGPLGINMGKIISEINAATSKFKGMRVPVVLDIDTKTKNFKIELKSPPVSELLKVEFAVEKGSGQPHKFKIANAPFETIIKIAKMKSSSMIVNDLKAAIKSVIGSCVSLGIIIDSRNAKDIIHDVEIGKYDDLIKEEKTEVDPEKKKQLDQFFEGIKKEQEEILKKEEEAKAAEEAAKLAATGQPAAAPGAPGAPAAGAKTAAAPEAKAAAPEEKKKEAKR
jgi:large subunit ribosomal protein L11